MVCYGRTTAGSEANYICKDSLHQDGRGDGEGRGGGERGEGRGERGGGEVERGEGREGEERRRKGRREVLYYCPTGEEFGSYKMLKMFRKLSWPSNIKTEITTADMVSKF